MNEESRLQKFYNKNEKVGSRFIGILLIAFGIYVIAHCLFPANPGKEISDAIETGEKVAFGFFLIMLGMPFFFPDLLQGSQVSTSMRIVVFMVVSVFVIITVKLAWSINDLSEFTIDNSWIYIIGLALGGQVTQNVVEILKKP